MPVHSSIGDYLIARLHAQGVAHVFGVPGDFVLRFYDLLAHSPLQVINTCDEQGAGFAADAYARSRGLGAVCVTYGVGGLKVANATAQAFAERVPVVVISGAPGLQERLRHPLLHHKVRAFDTQQKVFEQLTVASTVLDDRYTAVAEIDRVLAAAQEHKRPVYIELPRDMVTLAATRQHARAAAPAAGDAARLRAAVAEAVARLQVAQQPVILAGVEVQRFGLQQQLHDLAARTRIPVADTLLGKAVLGEHEPFYLGLYQGAMSRPEVRQYVEASDCVVLLGVLMTDINLGVYTAQLDPQRCISADAERISIGYHTYENVRFDAFVAALLAAELPPRSLPGAPPHAPAPDTDTAPPSGGEGAERVTVERLFGRISAFLRPDIAVIADPGDALFAAADLRTYQCSDFIAPAYYCSLGYAVPAALGLQLANPRCRPLVLVGDGAFQMSGLELSTALRFGLTPIVVVLNNGGYGTERPILDGPFNDITPWDYARVPAVVGGGRGFVVETVGQLDAALAAARAHTESFCVLDVRLERHDISPALRRLTERLAQQQGSALGRPGAARQRG